MGRGVALKPSNFGAVVLSLIGAFLLFGFQNCGSQARLVPIEKSSYSSKSLSASARICLPSNEVLETLIVRNINAKLVDAKLLMDSDGDGLDDAQEAQIGTNPFARRSSGKVLDSICRQVDYSAQCQGLQLACSNIAMDFGLNNCDIEALQLNTFFGHPNQGLDTDKDGVSDYFEIAAGTFPNVSDASADLDQDFIPNVVEIEVGGNPRQPEQNVPDEFYVKVEKSKMPPSLGCSGDMWDVEVQHIPLVYTQPYLTDTQLIFNHAENENVILINLKTRPRLGSLGNAKMYLLARKVQLPTSEQPQSLDFNFTFTDFQTLGEIEP